MRQTKVFAIILVLMGIPLIFCPNAWAVPSLQLYIDGATYDTDTETWVYPGLEYDLWAIGADNESNITILDVQLAAAVKSDQDGYISIQPIDGDGNLGTALLWTWFDNAIPLKGDGEPLPKHGIYPSDFYLFDLGDFVLDDQGIPDFTAGYDPDNPVPTNNWGKIMKYHVTVTGGYDWVHFDLFNHIEGENHALFAPFSHDADAEDGNPIPEPTTMLLFGSGILGLAGFRKKFRKNKKTS